MEICYDGALVMPKNYAVVNEEEMTYVEGGISVGPIYANDAADMYKAVRSAANGIYVCAVGVALSGSLLGAVVGAYIGLHGGPLGAAIGGCVGALIGSVTSVIGGCLMYSWASAYDTAADQARQLGHRRCVFEAHTSGLTMIASVRAC